MSTEAQMVKFRRNLATGLSQGNAQTIAELMLDRKRLEATPVPALMDMLAEELSA